MSEVNQGQEETFENTGGYADLALGDQPVELISGRETVQKTLEAIHEFREKLFPDLEMGEKTKAAFEGILTELTERPDAIQVDKKGQARFIQYELWDGKWISTYDGDPSIEVGQAMINTTTEWVEDASRRSGVALEAGQADAIAYRWLIWHELAHGLQAAYSRAAEARPTSLNDLPARLQEDTLTWEASEAYFGTQGSPVRDYSIIVESERFAEGFGLFMVRRYMEKAGFSPEDSESFRSNMEPPSRMQQKQATTEIVHKYQDRLIKWDMEASNSMYQELNQNNLTINKIGYATPHEPEKVEEIMKLTMRLEDLPWRERVKEPE